MQVQETPITHDVCCMDSHSYNGEETANANSHESISTRSETTTPQPFSTSPEGITPNSTTTTTPRQRSVTRSHGRAHTSGVNSARTNLLQRLRAQRHCDEAEANDVNTDENDNDHAFDKEEGDSDTCTATDMIVRENVKVLHCDPHCESDMSTTATTTANHTGLVTLPQIKNKVNIEDVVVAGLGEDEHTEWESTAGNSTSTTTVCHSASLTNTSTTTHTMSMATSFMSDFHVDCWTPETQAETHESLSTTTTTLTVDNTLSATGKADQLNMHSVENAYCCENEEKESHTTHNSATTSHSLTCTPLPVQTCPAVHPESCPTTTSAGGDEEELDERMTCALTRQCTTLCLAVSENDSGDDEHRDAEEDEDEDDGISATTTVRSVITSHTGTHVKAAEHSQRSYNTASSSTNSFTATTTTSAEEEEEEEVHHIAAEANMKHAMPVLTTVSSCDDLEADFGFIEPHPPCHDKQQQHTATTTTHSLCSCEECCACVRCCCGQEEEEEEDDEDDMDTFHVKDGHNRNSSIASPYSTSYLSHSQGHTVTHYEEDSNNDRECTSCDFRDIHHIHRHDESDEEAECDIVQQQHTMQTLNNEYSHKHEHSLTLTMSHNVNSPLHDDEGNEDDDGDVEEENIVEEEEEEGEEVDEATWRAMSPMAQLRHALRHCPRQEHPFLDMRRQAMLYENHRARQHNLYCLRMSHECTTSAADLLVASKVLVNYGHRLHLQRCRMHNAMVTLERRRRVGQSQGAEGNCNESHTECEEECQCMKENGEVGETYKTCRSGEVEHIDAAINKDNNTSSLESAQAAFDVTLDTYINRPHSLHAETGSYCDGNNGEYSDENDGEEVTKSAATLKDIDAIHRQWLTLAQAMEADLELDTHHLVQRRLSCMCIFNPDSDERRYTDNEETRERRLARQQATLMALRRQAEAGGSPYFLQ